MLPKVTRVERNVEFRLTITQNYVNLLFTASKLVITKTKVSKSEFLRLIMDIEPFSKKKHKHQQIFIQKGVIILHRARTVL